MLWSALPDTDGPEVKWPPVLKVRQNGALADHLDWPDRALKPLQWPAFSVPISNGAGGSAGRIAGNSRPPTCTPE